MFMFWSAESLLLMWDAVVVVTVTLSQQLLTNLQMLTMPHYEETTTVDVNLHVHIIHLCIIMIIHFYPVA